MALSGSPFGSDKIIPGDGLTFDDVLLLPRYVTFPREEADLSVQLHPNIRLKLPILSSPMDTVTEADMAAEMARSGGMGVIHRNLPVDVQADMTGKVKAKKGEGDDAAVDSNGNLLCAAAVGAGADLDERVEALIKAGVDVIVVDSGHGHAEYILDAVRKIRKKKSDQVIMGGNVATAEGAKALIDSGADIIRVGVGPGSICTTRIITGMGVPQISAILSAVEAAKGSSVTVVADGGIKQMGDMAKALACGAHAVMLGSLLAGYDQSPGETVTVDGTSYKQYRGMGSVTAMRKGSAQRYGQSEMTDEQRLIAEGVEGLVECKGPVSNFLYQAAGSLRSAFYYTGSKDILDLHGDAQFIRITQAGMQESHPHTISVTAAGSNYMS